MLHRRVLRIVCARRNERPSRHQRRVRQAQRAQPVHDGTPKAFRRNVHQSGRWRYLGDKARLRGKQDPIHNHPARHVTSHNKLAIQ